MAKSAKPRWEQPKSQPPQIKLRWTADPPDNRAGRPSLENLGVHIYDRLAEKYGKGKAKKAK